MASPVIQNEPPNQAGVHLAFVLHVHNLNHEEVERHLRLRVLNAQHGVHAHVPDEIGELLVELGPERRPRDAVEQLAVDLTLRGTKRVEELDRGCLCQVEAITQNARVNTLGEIALGLLQQLADKDDG